MAYKEMISWAYCVSRSLIYRPSDARTQGVIVRANTAAESHLRLPDDQVVSQMSSVPLVLQS